MENHTLESEDRTNIKKQNMVGYLEDRLRVTERSSLTCSGLSNMFRVLIIFYSEYVRRFSKLIIGSMESILKQGNIKTNLI